MTEKKHLIQDNIKLKKKIRKKNNLILKFRRLVEINSFIGASLDKKEVLKRILNQSKDLMECEFTSVLLIDPITNQLYFEVISDEEDYAKLAEVRLNKGEGIAGIVWDKGKPIVINDASRDKRFSNKADQKADSTTRSLLAVPLVVDGKIIGVMEAINKLSRQAFSRFDLEIFQNMSLQAAIAIQNASLYDLAITDGLTKLFIHRYFSGRLVEELNRAERYSNQLSLIIFDIDHFKNFNDTYGHQFGDEVLIRVADEIRKLCRVSDVPARYGGEEFCVILPQTTKDQANHLGERIRQKIEDMELVFNTQVVKLTISGGIAEYPADHPRNSSDLIHMADQALYHSKQNGRNRVSLYHDGLKD
jgi:diguanylate cyclase (GGDEF)-like protein